MKKSKLRRMKFKNWLLGKLNKILYKIYLRGRANDRDILMKFEKPKCFTSNSDTYPLCTGAKHPADFAENDCIRCKLYVNYNKEEE